MEKDWKLLNYVNEYEQQYRNLSLIEKPTWTQPIFSSP